METQGVPLPRALNDGDLAFLVLYAQRLRTKTRNATAAPEDEKKKQEELDRLRQHVLHLWHTCLAEATVLYRCVRELMFLQPRIDSHFHYPEVANTIASGSPARFLDLGCCFGTDTRRVIVDGWREEDVVAVDITPDFWNYGLKLYEDAAELKVPFRVGDVTSDATFVQSLVADGELFAHVWTGAVLHVLPEAKVEALLRSVFAVLRPGGSYFGTCVGVRGGPPTAWHPGYRNRSPAYLHSAESLQNLLQRIGFEEVVVQEQSPRTILPPSAQDDPTDADPPKSMLRFAACKKQSHS